MSEAVFSLAEAARRCGVSRTTLQNNIDALVNAGAIRTSAGWQIPVSALISLGYMPRTSPPDNTNVQHSTVQDVQHNMQPESADLQALRIENAVLKEQLKAAQAIATERERIIQSQEHSLRLLEKPKNSVENTQAGKTGPPLDSGTVINVPPPRRKWRNIFRRKQE